MDTPETRYARADDGVHLAYNVVGEGPIDLLWLGSFNGGVEMLYESPLVRSLTERLAGFARVIRHDMRATGLSDRHPPLPDLETQVRDILAVLDAAGSRSTVVVSAANPAGALFAATHPRRTRAFVFFDPWARELVAPDHPWGSTPEEAEADLKAVEATWGTDAWAAALLADVAPTLAGDRDLVRWYARLTRHWVAPGDAVELFRRWYETDIREVLPTIAVPTLCLVRNFEDGIEPAQHATTLIPGAELKILPGTERFTAAGDQEALVAAIRDFVGATPGSAVATTQLRAILFTDLVDSTSIAARLGDAAWRDLLERHHAIVRGELRRFGGTEEDTAGDGFFATFEGPGGAIRCARAIVDGVAGLGVSVRAGVHAGECPIIDAKTGGIAVVIGARIASMAGPSEVMASQTVKDLTAGSGLVFEDAGEHELKGVPDRWRLYRVVE